MLWINAVVGLLLLGERLFLWIIPTWIFFVTGGISILIAIPQSFAPKIVRSEFGDELTRTILNDLLEAIEPEIRTAVNLRCNLMRLDGQVLQVTAASPERVTPRATIQWTTDQGCCGMAVRRREPVVLNLSDYKGRPYEALIDGDDDLPKWGITPTQWNGNIPAI